MDSALLKAILSMDAYNRGYNANIDFNVYDENGTLIGTPTQLGNLTIASDSASLGFIDGTRDRIDESKGFYGISYQLPTGEVVIAYRGTDNLTGWNGSESGSDFWHGYGSGLGLPVGILGTGQAELALQFYQSVYSSGNTNISVTGHSLGGGLAGLVGDLYGLSGVVFDNMAYQDSAARTYESATAHPAILPGGEEVDGYAELRQEIYGYLAPGQTLAYNSSVIPHNSIDGLSAVYLDGQFLVANIVGQQGPKIGLNLVPDGTIPSEIDSGLTGGGLHSMAALVIRMYADTNDPSTDWHGSAQYFWPLLFDNGFAGGIADYSAFSGTALISGNYSEILREAIAYSAISEGTTVFGNTGIRALYHDADNLGAVLSAPGVSQEITAHATDISKVFVQYAGELALNKISSVDHPDGANGVIGFPGNGTLTVNLSDALWHSAGVSDELINLARANIVLPILDETGNHFGIDNAAIDLWGDNTTNVIDKVAFAVGDNGGSYTLTSAPDATTQQADLFVGGNGTDIVTGSSGNDLILGEGGNDILRGGDGKDILYGNTGFDTADYSQDNVTNGIRVTGFGATGNGIVTDGWGNMDRLFSIEKIIGTAQKDTFTLTAPSGLTIDGGGGGDEISYTGSVIQKLNVDGTSTVYDKTGSVHDTLIGVDFAPLTPPQHIVFNDQQAYGITQPGPHNYDYSALSGPASFNLGASGSWQDLSSGFGINFDISYSEGMNVSLSSGLSYDVLLASISAVVETTNPVAFISRAGSKEITGTNHGDYFNIDGSLVSAVLNTGAGNDSVFLERPSTLITYIYNGGYDHIYYQSTPNFSGNAPRIIMGADITPDQVSVVYDGTLLSLEVAGHGSLVVDNFFSNRSIEFVSGGEITFVGNTPVYNYDDSLQTLTISGTWGDDNWVGHNGRNETFYAYGGNDVLDGSTGDNTLYGGDGDDIYVYGGQGGDSLLIDRSGHDMISVADSSIHESDISYLRNGDDLMIGFIASGLNSDGQPVFTGTMTVQGFYAGTGSTINTLRLSDGSLDIDLDHVNIGTFIGTEIGETIDVSALNITNASIYGGGGDDTIYGSGGNDHIYGGDGDDTIYGNAGMDVLDGGTGNFNYLDGGAGNDTYILSGSAFSWVNDSEGVNRIIVDHPLPLSFDIDNGLNLYNENGEAYAKIFGSISTITFLDHSVVSLSDIFLGNDVIYGITDGDDFIDLPQNGTLGDFSVDLLAGNDYYQGGSWSDVVDGGEGHDLLFGSYGDDILIGGPGNDNLLGGQGNDFLDGGDDYDSVNYANDVSATSGVTVNLSNSIATNDGFGTVDTLINIESVIGSNFSDNITGSDVDNQLSGLDGDDVLVGLGGDDFLTGGLGDDVLDGGFGNDTYTFFIGDGFGDIIQESGGIDQIVIHSGLTIADVVFTRNGNDLLVTYDDAVTIRDFYSGDPSKVVEMIRFDNGTTFDLTTLLSEITPANNPPIARPDDFAGTQDTDIEGNLLADNGHGADYDLDGDTLKVVQNMITSAAGGSVILMANGDFVYMPPAGFTGTDSFNYTVTDNNGGNANATATLNIAALPPLNQDPVAEADNFSGHFLDSITGNVLNDNGHGADYDLDGDGLTVQPAIFTTAGGGVVSLNADGSYTYTPSSGFIGQDSFTYTLNDGRGGSSVGVATLDITSRADQIIGTAGDDVLAASNNRDATIAGLAGDDKITGKGGNDVLIGGAGNDIIRGGSGNDTIIGDDVFVTKHLYSSDNILYPETIETVNIARLNPDGTPNLGIVHGDLISNTPQTATITFVQTVAGYNNSLGSYIIGADGTIQAVNLEFANVKNYRAGDTATLHLPGNPDSNFGFFIISDGARANHDYAGLDLNGDNLEFWYNYGQADQRLANINDSSDHISLVYNDGAQVKILQGDIYHTTERGSADLDINPDHQIHAISGLISDGNTDSLRIGFEDLKGTGDADYNDVVFDIKINPVYGDTGTVGGNDILTGGAGADTFVFTTHGGIDTITDFHKGEGDRLDLSNLIKDYDPVDDIISQFVHMEQQGSNEILSVDVTGSGQNFQTIAVLQNVSGLNVEDLFQGGHLVV